MQPDPIPFQYDPDPYQECSRIQFPIKAISPDLQHLRPKEVVVMEVKHTPELPAIRVIPTPEQMAFQLIASKSYCPRSSDPFHIVVYHINGSLLLGLIVHIPLLICIAGEGAQFFSDHNSKRQLFRMRIKLVMKSIINISFY